MEGNIDRRKVLSMAAGSAAATGIVGNVTAASDEEYCEADWEDEADEDDYSATNVDSDVSMDATSYNNVTHLSSNVSVLDALETDQGVYSYKVGIGGYAQSSEDSWGDCDFIRSHGLKLEVPSDQAALYEPRSSEKTLVAPDASGGDSPSDIESAAFTILTSAIGLVHPVTGAATAAASAVSAGIDAVTNSNDGENYAEYMWGDSNPSPNDFSAVAHYAEFWIDSDPSLHNYETSFEATIKQIASSGVYCLDSVDGCYHPEGQSYASVNKYLLIYYGNAEGRIGSLNSTDEKEQVPKEELIKKGMPDELLDKGPFYESDVSLNKKE